MTAGDTGIDSSWLPLGGCRKPVDAPVLSCSEKIIFCSTIVDMPPQQQQQPPIRKSIHHQTVHDFSHDLKNTLTVIFLHLELLKKYIRSGDSEKSDQYAVNLEKNLNEALKKLETFVRKMDSL